MKDTTPEVKDECYFESDAKSKDTDIVEVVKLIIMVMLVLIYS